VPDIGLDAVDLLPGGEIAFSIRTDFWSETLGQLGHGDVLSDRGRILRTNVQSLTPFVSMPPIPHVGLDALQVMDTGESYFSVEDEIFSEKLGRVLRRWKTWPTSAWTRFTW